MTVISEAAEREVMAALQDPNLPKTIKDAIVAAIVNTGAEKGKYRNALQQATNASLPDSARIVGYQKLVDYMTGEST